MATFKYLGNHPRQKDEAIKFQSGDGMLEFREGVAVEVKDELLVEKLRSLCKNDPKAGNPNWEEVAAKPKEEKPKGKPKAEKPKGAGFPTFSGA